MMTSTLGPGTLKAFLTCPVHSILTKLEMKCFILLKTGFSLKQFNFLRFLLYLQKG